MGKLRGAVIVISMIVLVMAWFNFMTEPNDEEILNRQYEEIVRVGDEYFEKELYQLAAQKYQLAVTYKDELDTWNKMLTAYEDRILEDATDTDSQEAYEQALKEAYERYPEEEDIFEKLLECLELQQEYEDMCTYIQAAIDAGNDDEDLNNRLKSIKYMIEEVSNRNAEYHVYMGEAYQNFVFQTDEGAILLGAGGEKIGKLPDQLQFVKSVSDEMVLYVSGGDVACLVDSNGIIQAKVDPGIEDASGYSENLIALKYEGKYNYYSLHGDLQEEFGSYDAASCFQSGKAVVKEGTEWKLLDATGTVLSTTSFEDIVLSNEGKYINYGVILAEEDGKYHLYDENFSQIGDFECDAVDRVTEDGIIAFEKKGKWGFVDTQGEILLKPTYDEAKSFSNGLAAVKENGNWGFVDTDFECVIVCQYADAYYFNENGYCVIMKNQYQETDETQEENVSDQTQELNEYVLIKRVVNIK